MSGCVMPLASRSRRPGKWLALMLSAMLGAAAIPDGAHAQGLWLDPSRVAWTRLDFSAAKWFLNARTAVSVAPTAGDSKSLRMPGEGDPVAAAEVIMLAIESSGLGTDSAAVLSIDACSGAALQYDVVDRGRRNRQRTYRYTHSGVYQWTRFPETGEEERDPQTWSRRESGFRPYPPDAIGADIVDPLAILYIIAASGLEQPGDALDMVIYSRRQATRLAVVAEEFADIAEVAARHRNIADLAQPTGADQALVVRLTPRALVPTDEQHFEFMGLSRDIRVWLEPASRVPVRITGAARLIGRLNIELEAADLSPRATAAAASRCLSSADRRE